jgi:hypothetical protein
MGSDSVSLVAGDGPRDIRKESVMSDDFEFEIIPESEITRTPRGRKSNVDPKLVKALGGLKSGQAARLQSMKLDPSASTYKADKARVSASLRSACRQAGHSEFGIVFTPDGVPQVKIK